MHTPDFAHEPPREPPREASHTDAEVLLQAATWFKWIRDADWIPSQPLPDVSEDELNAVIQHLEQIAYRLQREQS